MAQRKRIALETEPHVYDIDFGPDNGGVVELKFRPEVFGAEFADAQAELAGTQAELKGIEDGRRQQIAAEAALRRFLATFMLPESAQRFVTFDNSQSIIVDKLGLPDWVLQDMTQWVVETYGRRPTGPSPDSAPPPSPPGKPSTAGGHSKASTRKSGTSRRS